MSVRNPEPTRSRPLIGVAGIACRLPGAANPEEFWAGLVAGRDAVSSSVTPEGRKPGGYLGDADSFDAGFFRFSAVEAAATDPQQRLLLQLTWHLLEDAGVDGRSLSGLRIGVYIGCASDDYAMLTRARGAEALTAWTLVGTSRTFLANRVAHFFKLQGPSLVIDTGQSSSLAALHAAWNALCLQQVDAAIVGAVQLNVDPLGDDIVSQLGIRSPRGRCRPFGEDADGIVRGEGAAAVLLVPQPSPLTVARTPYCFLEAVAMSSDSGSAELTSPSVDGQIATLRQAYALAGVNPAQVDYVEAHGTGTPAGDPVEAEALGTVCGVGREAGSPLLIGSVKSNIGHLEAAAGLAGLIKAILCLRHGLIPATLTTGPSGAIGWTELNLKLVQENQPWPGSGAVRLAGVSSFGLGGTSCHAVLRTPVLASKTSQAGHSLMGVSEPEPLPFVISGNSRDAMRRQAAALAEVLGQEQITDVRAISRSLGRERTPLAYRAAVLASGPKELESRLRAIAEGDGAELADRPAVQGKVAFLFPGQGMQRRGLGQQLYDTHRAFRRAFAEVARLAAPSLGADLRDLMWGSEDWVDRLEFAQPALFAVEVALVALLREWGIAPDYLIGHSQGEITAAYVAGLVGLADATHLVVERGRLIASLPADGAMVAVNAPAPAVEKVLAKLTGVVTIAAVNSPASVVISGAEEPVRLAQAAFAARGTQTRRLRASKAGHSVLMEPMMDRLAEFAGRLTWKRPNGPTVISTATGKIAQGSDLVTARYWADHLIKPVRFAEAVDVARRAGTSLFIEVGPGHGLSTMVLECLDAADCTVCATLDSSNERASALSAVGGAFVHGLPLRWERIARTLRSVPLPLYAFEDKRYWLDQVTVGDEPAEALNGSAGPKATASSIRSAVLAAIADFAVNPPGERSVLTTSFADLGIDSKGALAVRSLLAKHIQVALPSTVLFDYPTPQELIRYCVQECGRMS
jgi:acyl transferase domain-containing protein